MDSALETLYNQCRQSLSEAALTSAHPWRLTVVANSDLAGNPQSRYVVFRDADFEQSHTLSFFTDFRSSKVPALKRNPKISLCFFDPIARLQLEVRAIATVHNQDETALKYWNATSWYSLQCYYMKENPGEVLQAPFILKPKELSEEQAYKYFTVISCESIVWDVLMLKNEGNQRAAFRFNANGELENAIWVAP
jgi:pyridoxamine 5'-phosphate oxidase